MINIKNEIFIKDNCVRKWRLKFFFFNSLLLSLRHRSPHNREMIKFFCLKQLITFNITRHTRKEEIRKFSAEPVFSSFNIPFFNILLLTVASIKLFLALRLFQLFVYLPRDLRKKHWNCLRFLFFRYGHMKVFLKLFFFCSSQLTKKNLASTIIDNIAINVWNLTDLFSFFFCRDVQ